MQLFFVSCRNDLGSPTEFGEPSFFIWRPQDKQASTISRDEYFRGVGDRPLILIHGFRCHIDDLYPALEGIAEKIAAYAYNNPTVKGYTSVSMFTWPAGLSFAPAIISGVSFFRARKRTARAAGMLGDLLEMFQAYPEAQITLQGHSLGGSIAVQAMRAPRTHPQVRQVVLAAAACPPEWLDEATLRKAPSWRIAFATVGDRVLAYLYRLMTWGHKALGQTGPIGYDYGVDVQSLNLSPCRHSGQWKDHRYIRFLWYVDPTEKQ